MLIQRFALNGIISSTSLAAEKQQFQQNTFAKSGTIAGIGQKLRIHHEAHEEHEGKNRYIWGAFTTI